jgi:hypothetical protein
MNSFRYAAAVTVGNRRFALVCKPLFLRWRIAKVNKYKYKYKYK